MSDNWELRDIKKSTFEKLALNNEAKSINIKLRRMIFEYGALYRDRNNVLCNRVEKKCRDLTQNNIIFSWDCRDFIFYSIRFYGPLLLENTNFLSLVSEQYLT